MSIVRCPCHALSLRCIVLGVVVVVVSGVVGIGVDILTLGMEAYHVIAL